MIKSHSRRFFAPLVALVSLMMVHLIQASTSSPCAPNNSSASEVYRSEQCICSKASPPTESELHMLTESAFMASDLYRYLAHVWNSTLLEKAGSVRETAGLSLITYTRQREIPLDLEYLLVPGEYKDLETQAFFYLLARNGESSYQEALRSLAYLEEKTILSLGINASPCRTNPGQCKKANCPGAGQEARCAGLCATSGSQETAECKLSGRKGCCKASQCACADAEVCSDAEKPTFEAELMEASTENLKLLVDELTSQGATYNPAILPAETYKSIVTPVN